MITPPRLSIRAALSLLALIAMLSCGDDYDGIVTIACPPIDDFKLVSSVLEQRCGSMDCHGSITRPLKIYGNRGLRRYTSPQQLVDSAQAVTDGVYPNGKPTTDNEREANRRSICGLEPEKMSLVMNGELDPRELLVLNKPTLSLTPGVTTDVQHKGGAQFVQGQPGEECLRSWLLGDINEADCNAALLNP